ncbi:uncharacterized protein J7T54_007776 [Emericellopsis cladophorae]|uniref:Amine oxidase domain-containing protein n=1 Tax=Emericellopsis cladophorae TaxID=2686198 RepID=A0A9P9XXN3_9HYPO|nr:uncharacterized protein J7T54_007776 [Emericellopsis cladophorae]KAI6779249.1 hypothetical protein J7T54_007776 [Emericellopsis cladophorae]
MGDSNGLWFNGVEYLNSTKQTSVSVGEAKSKKIAIVGGGMSVLMTSLLLTSVGMTNWHITESTERIGGRVRTRCLNDSKPDNYQYQEMRPIRFPVAVKYTDSNETLDIQDPKLVFQLSDVLNGMNGNDIEPAVNVILASYASAVQARSVAALSEEDHVALVQEAMVEVHGEIANEQWAGAYDRQCWEVDEHQAGAWASVAVGQQELFIPAYHKSELNTIFIGDHTSITHAWIFFALESAVRGTTQLLLELGLVDEVKKVVDTWMARWITI